MKQEWLEPQILSLDVSETMKGPEDKPQKCVPCFEATGNQHRHGAQLGKCGCCDEDNLLEPPILIS
ncbi:MAG: hypothetical protein RR448_10905 [Niameybacter sp.]